MTDTNIHPVSDEAIDYLILSKGAPMTMTDEEQQGHVSMCKKGSLLIHAKQVELPHTR